MKMQKFVRFVKRNLKINMIKNMVELATIVLIHVNIDELHRSYVIQNMVYLKKFLKFFTMDLTMINIFS